MPVPKRKNCRARSRKRRGGHKKLTASQVMTCAKCGELKMPHRVCPSCGHYRGKEIMSLEEE